MSTENVFGLVCLEWVANVLYSLSKELIKKSFKICAVTTSTDDGKDHLIHCFKHVIPNGLELLRQARAEEQLAEQKKMIWPKIWMTLIVISLLLNSSVCYNFVLIFVDDK